MSIFSFLGNPIAFAAVTVVAIGVIVYQIVNQQNEERVHASGSNYRKPESSTDSSSTNFRTVESDVRCRKTDEHSAKSNSSNVVKQKYKNANGRNNRKPGSSTDSSSTNFRTVESDVRRQKTDEHSAKPSSSNVKQKYKNTSDETVTKRSNFNEEQYRQNVFDKIEKDVKNFNQRDENTKQFDKNIDVSNGNETDDSENLDETEVINLNVLSATHHVALSQHGSSANDAKKGKSQETKLTNSDLSISASGVVERSNQDMTGSRCRACEEVPANAVAYPCNHCYLCANCATMVFRIYRKCTICDSHVEIFQILTN